MAEYKHVKNWLTGKDPDAGKDWRQKEKGMTEDEMVGWHHWLYGHEFEQTPGVGDGQGCLVCCSPWGCKESDTTEWLNWTDTHTNTQTYTLRLYPFICWWTFEFSYVLGIVNSTAMNIEVNCILLNYRSVWIYAQEWDCRIMWLVYF